MTVVVLSIVLLLIAALVVWDQIERPKRRRAALARDEAKRQEASARGWSLEIHRTGDRITTYHYSGATAGVPWQFLAGSWSSLTTDDRSRTKIFSRWSTELARIDDGVMVIWPSFGAEEGQRMQTAVPQFVLKTIMRPLVLAIDGEPADAERIIQSSAVTPDDEVVGRHFYLRASDPQRMERFLQAGGSAALREASTWLPHRGEHALILGLFWRRGCTLLLRGWIDDADHIEQIAELGARLSAPAAAQV